MTFKIKFNPVIHFVMPLLAILPGLVVCQNVAAAELKGKLGGEVMGFIQAAKYPEQNTHYGSVFIEPELYQATSDHSEIAAKLFYRYDANDPSRTHADIRELMFYHYADDWELHAGVGKVFWGTTESRHLVDVVNQTDRIESLDDEARLGQPILQATLIKEWGTVDLMLLPGFRPQQFGGKQSRPRLNPVASSTPLYQSSDKENTLDLAARWSHSLGDLDIALSYFKGTQRTPLFIPILENSQPKLRPVYVQTQQFGLDAQYVAGDLLLKAEALNRENHQVSRTGVFSKDHSVALVAGLEYTIVGLFETTYDLGIIGEYLYDESSATTPFQNDWMTGFRWVMNDAQSTEVLLGSIIDLDNGSQIWSLEASRRLGDNWTAELTGRWFNNIAATDTLLSPYQQDDLIDLKVEYYF